MARASETLTTEEMRLGKLALKNAKARAGNGWDILGADLREALVAREIASIILGQAGEEYAPAQIMLHAAFVALNPTEGLR